MPGPRKPIKVAVIYDGYGHKGVYQAHEYRVAESIFPDVVRVRDILRERGDQVRLVPMIRSAAKWRNSNQAATLSWIMKRLRLMEIFRLRHLAF